MGRERYIYLLDNMIKYCDEIKDFTRGSTFESFRGDIKTIRAVSNNIIQIGELANKMGSVIRKDYTVVDWDGLVVVRNIFAHDYENVSVKRLWETVIYDLDYIHSWLHVIKNKENQLKSSKEKVCKKYEKNAFLFDGVKDKELLKSFRAEFKGVHGIKVPKPGSGRSIRIK